MRERKRAMPEVYRFWPHHSVVLYEPLQKLWKAINPELDGIKWRSLLGSTLAFTNNSTGFGRECHADYVNHRDLKCKPPSFDFSRFCGGAIVKGKLSGERVYIQTVRTNGKLPTAQELLNSPHLWFYATSISPTGRIQYIQRIGIDRKLHRVRIPLFTEQEVWLPKNEVHLLGEADQKIEPNTIVYQ